ncbi:hypothetical protein BZ20_4181 (plasmid) [Yersinia pseudotuberculosis]|nr:hypothetical protein BZ20_4181 [Yersinia pseudotuberculosis]
MCAVWYFFGRIVNVVTNKGLCARSIVIGGVSLFPNRRERKFAARAGIIIVCPKGRRRIGYLFIGIKEKVFKRSTDQWFKRNHAL